MDRMYFHRLDVRFIADFADVQPKTRRVLNGGACPPHCNRSHRRPWAVDFSCMSIRLTGLPIQGTYLIAQGNAIGIGTEDPAHRRHIPIGQRLSGNSVDHMAEFGRQFTNWHIQALDAACASSVSVPRGAWWCSCWTDMLPPGAPLAIDNLVVVTRRGIFDNETLWSGVGSSPTSGPLQ